MTPNRSRAGSPKCLASPCASPDTTDGSGLQSQEASEEPTDPPDPPPPLLKSVIKRKKVAFNLPDGGVRHSPRLLSKKRRNRSFPEAGKKVKKRKNQSCPPRTTENGEEPLKQECETTEEPVESDRSLLSRLCNGVGSATPHWASGWASGQCVKEEPGSKLRADLVERNFASVPDWNTQTEMLVDLLSQLTTEPPSTEDRSHLTMLHMLAEAYTSERAMDMPDETSTERVNHDIQTSEQPRSVNEFMSREKAELQEFILDMPATGELAATVQLQRELACLRQGNQRLALQVETLEQAQDRLTLVKAQLEEFAQLTEAENQRDK